MLPLLRVLVASTTPLAAERAKPLVDAVAGENWRVRYVDLDAAAQEFAVSADWDVLVCVVAPPISPFETALEAIQEFTRGASIVLLVDEYTAEIASLAQRFGTRLTLFSIGAPVFALSLERAAQVSVERREREDARAAERVRALIYANVSDVIAYVSNEGESLRFVDVNEAFFRVTGLSRADVIGRRVEDVIPPSSLDLVLARYREAIASKRTVHWEEVTEYPNGTKFGDVAATPVITDEGECTGLVITVHDVTEARKRDAEIFLYANTVQAMELGLTVWRECPDGSFALRAANPAASASLGFDRDANADLPLDAVFPGQSGAPVRELVARVASREPGAQFASYDVTREDGRVGAFAIKAFSLSPGHVALSFEDVSAQKRARAINTAEQAALESVAAGASIAKTLGDLLDAVEPLIPGAIGLAVRYSPDGRRITVEAAKRLDAELARAIGDASPTDLRGLCGVPGRREQLISDDLAVDEGWMSLRKITTRAGLRSCWSYPIVASDGRALGLIAVFSIVSRRPTDEDTELVLRATHVAGMAIERHALDEQLRALSTRIEAAREEERTGIAREIHDQLGQSLTALKFDMAWVLRRLAAHADDAPSGRDAMSERLRAMTSMTDEVIQHVRKISADLRPGVLDDLGLLAALEWQANDFTRRTGVACVVRSDLGDRRLDRGLSTALFRVFQEALTNVARHANAQRVDASLDSSGEHIQLVISDDGRGIEPSELASPTSLGLLGMKERVRRFGGQVSFERGNDGRGTRVSVDVPLVVGVNA